MKLIGTEQSVFNIISVRERIKQGTSWETQKGFTHAAFAPPSSCQLSGPPYPPKVSDRLVMHWLLLPKSVASHWKPVWTHQAWEKGPKNVLARNNRSRQTAAHDWVYDDCKKFQASVSSIKVLLFMPFPRLSMVESPSPADLVEPVTQRPQKQWEEKFAECDQTWPCLLRTFENRP